MGKTNKKEDFVYFVFSRFLLQNRQLTKLTGILFCARTPTLFSFEGVHYLLAFGTLPCLVSHTSANT